MDKDILIKQLEVILSCYENTEEGLKQLFDEQLPTIQVKFGLSLLPIIASNKVGKDRIMLLAKAISSFYDNPAFCLLLIQEYGKRVQASIEKTTELLKEKGREELLKHAKGLEKENPKLKAACDQNRDKIDDMIKTQLSQTKKEDDDAS